jgi:hypothetical protein
MLATLRRFNARRLPALAGFASLVLLTVSTPGQDTVILRDGTVLKGRLFKQKESIFDKSSGVNVIVDKANGLEGIDTGLKYIFFSTHSRQVAEVTKDGKNIESENVYERKSPKRSSHDIPSGFGEITYTPWDKNWKRTMRIDFKPPNTGFETIEQALWHIDPYVIRIASTTHKQGMAYATSEWTPADILALLSTHPDLVEEPGKPDAMKRMRKVEFLMAVGQTRRLTLAGTLA